MKSGNLNFLEPSRPLQACNGTALPLPLIFAETFTDVVLSSWVPYYYEIKAVLVLWLLSPYTKGSWTLYNKCVHPLFSQHEWENDKIKAIAKELRFHNTLNLCTFG